MPFPRMLVGVLLLAVLAVGCDVTQPLRLEDQVYVAARVEHGCHAPRLTVVEIEVIGGVVADDVDDT